MIGKNGYFPSPVSDHTVIVNSPVLTAYWSSELTLHCILVLEINFLLVLLRCAEDWSKSWEFNWLTLSPCTANNFSMLQRIQRRKISPLSKCASEIISFSCFLLLTSKAEPELCRRVIFCYQFLCWWEGTFCGLDSCITAQSLLRLRFSSDCFMLATCMKPQQTLHLYRQHEWMRKRSKNHLTFTRVASFHRLKLNVWSSKYLGLFLSLFFNFLTKTHFVKSNRVKKRRPREVLFLSQGHGWVKVSAAKSRSANAQD